MVALIKSGAFDNMMDRKLCMGWYIWESCEKKKRITLQNMASLIKYHLLPEEESKILMARRIYEFNRYLKSVCKYRDKYKLNERALNFLIEIEEDELLENDFFIDTKQWDKLVYQPWMDVIRQWINENKEEVLYKLNLKIFQADWNKYGLGSLSSWEMEVICFYYHPHELSKVNLKKYGLVNFFKLPEEPTIERTFYTKKGTEINIYNIYRICGTCIAKDKIHSTVSLLTTFGVVTVKFRKEYFSLFDKQISEIGEDGKKHVVERSRFNRGNKIIVQGFRSGDTFISKKYASTGGHQMYLITKVNEDGTLELSDHRPGIPDLGQK